MKDATSGGKKRGIDQVSDEVNDEKENGEGVDDDSTQEAENNSEV